MESQLVRKKSHRKVKTGCITCRIRRVKCDEDKPNCRRCTSTGRKCDGYPLASWVFGKAPTRPSSIGGNDAECHAIYQFRTRIASLLASSFDRKFWMHDLIHNAESFIPVRHALAGLASAYQKSIVLGNHSPTCDRFIFEQYDKALKSLHECFQIGKRLSRTQQSAALVANLLFVFLCSLQGLRQEALIHLRNGLALIHEWSLDTSMMGDDTQTTLMADILALYTRLDTQSRVICQDVRTAQTFKGLLLSQTSKKPENPTVCQALFELESLHNQILQLADDEPYSDTKSTYQQALSSWDTQFHHLASTSPHVSHITALKMRREVVEITLSMKINTEDITTYIDTHCSTILDLAHQLSKEIDLKLNQVSFNLASGLVEALYFVAVTSKDWDLRQQAIHHLRRYRLVDGIWGSHDAADLAFSRLQDDMNIYRLQLGQPGV
ncbi:transcriptional regulatory [Fusarium longipes]|uniref:Transcriptional regulatory n=1 Tax=Fusarium longipes TaxID=694270 RepID=A0A395T405_9HYPO|nr:transcriptional regulatory [Fusarium longipes]